MLMSGKQLCVLICQEPQKGLELEFNFRNILLFKCVDTSGNVSNAVALSFSGLRIKLHSSTQITLHKSIQIFHNSARRDH